MMQPDSMCDACRDGDHEDCNGRIIQSPETAPGVFDPSDDAQEDVGPCLCDQHDDEDCP